MAAKIKRNGGMLLLGLVSLGGVSATAPARHLYFSAHQFATYYRAVGEAKADAGFMERVAISLVLVSTECEQAAHRAAPIS